MFGLGKRKEKEVSSKPKIALGRVKPITMGSGDKLVCIGSIGEEDKLNALMFFHTKTPGVVGERTYDAINEDGTQMDVAGVISFSSIESIDVVINNLNDLKKNFNAENK